MTTAAPLDERWSFGDVVTFTAIIFGVFASTGAVAVLEGWPTGVAMFSFIMAVVFGYESGLIPHYKWEVRRRLFPASPNDTLEDSGE